jgi:catechol 2,3-dioxygenase-like lactoylglutathione lyase family enzyme
MGNSTSSGWSIWKTKPNLPEPSPDALSFDPVRLPVLHSTLKRFVYCALGITQKFATLAEHDKGQKHDQGTARSRQSQEIVRQTEAAKDRRVGVDESDSGTRVGAWPARARKARFALIVAVELWTWPPNPITPNPMKTEIHHLIDQFAEGRISRRQLIAGLTALLALASGSRRAGAAEASSAPLFQAVGLNHIALRVTHVPLARDFYVRHLGLEVTRDGGENSCFLSFDDGFLALFRGEEPRMDHYCYSVKDYDVETAAEKLKGAGITPRVTGNRIYFDDPDGLEVQLAAPAHRA